MNIASISARIKSINLEENLVSDGFEQQNHLQLITKHITNDLSPSTAIVETPDHSIAPIDSSHITG